MVVRADNGGISLSGNAGGSVGLRITTGNAIQGLGPVAAALVDMTPDKGTFTITATGNDGTGTITGTATWSRNGNQATIAIPYLVSTSNATTFTLTGIPAAIQPATLTQVVHGLDITDGSANKFGGGEIQITAASGTWTVFNNGTNTWTASGSKSLGSGNPQTISYMLI